MCKPDLYMNENPDLQKFPCQTHEWRGLNRVVSMAHPMRFSDDFFTYNLHVFTKSAWWNACGSQNDLIHRTGGLWHCGGKSMLSSPTKRIAGSLTLFRERRLPVHVKCKKLCSFLLVRLAVPLMVSAVWLMRKLSGLYRDWTPRFSYSGSE